jgi:hypothetical protein
MSARTREVPGVGHGGGVDDGDDGGGKRAREGLAAEILQHQLLVGGVETETRRQLPRCLPCWHLHYCSSSVATISSSMSDQFPEERWNGVDDWSEWKRKKARNL